MSLTASDSVGGQTFDLKSLFFDLVRFCRSRFRNWGCLQPDDCAEDVVSNYVLERKLRKEGRCQIFEDKIVINIPDAIDQSKVLHSLLLFEILNKKSKCRECKFSDTCQIAESFEANEETARHSTTILADPVTPEDLLRGKEVVEAILNAIPNPRRRAAFQSLVLDGSSYQEIAERLKVKTSTVRQWFVRDKRRLRKLFVNLIRPEGRDSRSSRPGHEPFTFSKHRREALISGMVEANASPSDASQFLKLKTTKGAK